MHILYESAGIIGYCTCWVLDECEWLNQQSKSSESKVKFRQASNHCKRVLEVVKLAYANKTKESITSQGIYLPVFPKESHPRGLLC